MEEPLTEESFDAPRRAVSSGAPSLDGSLDEERGVCSDSEVLNALRTEELVRQVRGPSSDDLEHECARERIQEVKAEVLGTSNHVHSSEKLKVNQDGWEDILGSGHLMKKVIRVGRDDARPESGQVVTIRVSCSTNPVDNHHDRLTFLLGYNFYVDAWDLVLKLMQAGEIAAIKTSARFAYGELGLDDKIPPNQSQEYEIELLEIGERLSFEDKPIEEAEKFIELLKDRGNFHYKRENFEPAVRLYKKGIEIIENEIRQKDLNPMLAMLYANLSACYTKLNDWSTVLETTEKSLELHPDNPKVLFRRAKAHINRHEYEEAIEVLRNAIKLEPSDKFMSRELIRVQRLQADQLQKEKRMYKRMLQGIEDRFPGQRIRLFSLRYFILSLLVVAFALFIHLFRQYLFP